MGKNIEIEKTAKNAQSQDAGYQCWLNYRPVNDPVLLDEYKKYCLNIIIFENNTQLDTAVKELQSGIQKIIGLRPVILDAPRKSGFVMIGTCNHSASVSTLLAEKERNALTDEGFLLKTLEDKERQFILVTAKTDKGLLYGTFALLRKLQTGQNIAEINQLENPKNPLRMMNHWDNLDGSIERGYAGKSFFFRDQKLLSNRKRVTDYARLLASIGINGVVINNVNVRDYAIRLITRKYLPNLRSLAELFRSYGIKLYLSINYASPVLIDNLPTADPLDEAVRVWWCKKAAEIYSAIPDFGGFLVKADSEFTPGPCTYGRNHAEGANMLAEALKPFGGLVIWRCFVYNCTQDWRDRTIDRAKAAYDNFMPLDGAFDENVILQIKNGPVDFQVREPVSPLLGGLKKTNQIIEFQITQEYTGQQKHLCFLIPQWKEVLDFDTFAKGEGSPVGKVVDGSLFNRPHSGFAGVSNLGDDVNWTGHDLAQANFYGYGRLAWNPELTAQEIAEEWVKLTFPNEPVVAGLIPEMLLASGPVYEKYTAPLGVGWMVNPNHHYGPNVDGYEYSRWGTYHRADCFGIGVDRTSQTGTGYTGQYYPPNAMKYESLATCPDDLVLFFHHLPYAHQLHSGETVIQHIYNTHFEGVEQVDHLRAQWMSLREYIETERFERVLKRLDQQLEHSKEWRDVINTYFFRKTGIPDCLGRKIHG